MISDSFTEDCVKIIDKFNYLKEQYENGLDESCTTMIKQLIVKRDEHLQEVSDFIENTPPKTQNEIKKVSNSIESNYLSFSSGVTSIFESILSRSNLETKFNFYDMIKYSFLTKRKCEKINLTPLSELKYDFFVFNISKLTSNLYFLYFEFKNGNNIDNIKQKCMAIIKQKGDILHTKMLAYKEIIVEVNETNVVLFDKISNKIEIYDFRLEVLRCFDLDKSIEHIGFLLKGFDIVFFDKVSCILEFHDYKNKLNKPKRVDLKDIKEKFRYDGVLNLNLLNLNHEFLVFSNVLGCDRKILYVISRDNFKFLFKYEVNGRTFCYMHEDLGIYLLEFSGNKIGIFFATQNGFRMLGKTVQLDNHIDLIRFFINKSHVYVNGYKDVCLKSIF